MKKMMICIISWLAISAQPVLAVETQKSDASIQQKTADTSKNAQKAKPVDASKKPAPAAKSTGSKVKDTWNKLTESVKHGKKSGCTPEQKHLNTCK